MRFLPLLAVLALAACATAPSRPTMGFFITSHNPGRGGDFGGLAGADQFCQDLASNAGHGAKRWRAYLSASAQGSMGAVNARDRIGRGPWHNAKGELIASNVAELHSDSNKLNKQTALTERGAVVRGRGDTPNDHDILTGSTPEGMLATGTGDTTCGNWTRSDAQGSAIVGHHDRLGLQDNAPARSWNSSHASRGCSPEGLRSTGSGGFLYCFAAN